MSHIEEEDLVDIDKLLNHGDEYSTDDYWADIEYAHFEAMMDELKYGNYNLIHYGHEDGPEAYAAELYEEDLLKQEIAEEQLAAEEQAWEDHLNPIQAFERQKMWELENLGSYPDSHDRYEWYGLQAEEMADEFGPEPKNEDECKY